MRARDCSGRGGVARRQRKPKAALSQQITDLNRDMSASLGRGRLSPSARAALLALIDTLAELLGEAPVAA
jgi:hypothetical protein